MEMEGAVMAAGGKSRANESTSQDGKKKKKCFFKQKRKGEKRNTGKMVGAVHSRSSEKKK